jgi:small subunit ribosomal protein S21
MIIINNIKDIEKALKEYKRKVNKTKQTQKLQAGKEFVKPSVIKRAQKIKAKYIQLKYRSDKTED